MKAEKATVSAGEAESDSETEKQKPLSTGGRAGPFSALAHRNYRIFFGSQILSLPGTWLQLVAEGWLVYDLTGSALALGLIRFLHTIPVTLLSVTAGGLADRYDKRRVLVVTQSVAMIVAFVLFLLAYKGNIQVWQLSCLALVLGIANAFDIPTRQSFIVDLVGRPDLMNAIALNSSVFNSARIVGPAIAGILISTVGVAYCFLLNSISFLFVLFGYLSLRLAKKREVTEGEKKDRGIGAAFRVVMATPSLRRLMGMTALTSVFGMSYSTLMPIFAEDIWYVGPKGLGSLLAANGVGALLGSITLALLSHSGRGPLLVKVGSTGFAASMIGFAFCPNAYFAMGALVLSGWFMVLFYATTNTLVQGQAPDRLRGRIMGLYTLCFIGLVPFGAFLSGALARWAGAPTAVVIGSIVCLVASGILWRTPIR